STILKLPDSVFLNLTAPFDRLTPSHPALSVRSRGHCELTNIVVSWECSTTNAGRAWVNVSLASSVRSRVLSKARESGPVLVRTRKTLPIQERPLAWLAGATAGYVLLLVLFRNWPWTESAALLFQYLLLLPLTWTFMACRCDAKPRKLALPSGLTIVIALCTFLIAVPV